MLERFLIKCINMNVPTILEKRVAIAAPSTPIPKVLTKRISHPGSPLSPGKSRTVGHPIFWLEKNQWGGKKSQL